MRIENCSLEDVNTIHKFYLAAREFQIQKGSNPWPDISLDVIREEVRNKQQWKLVSGGEICGVWITAFHDADIWGGKDNDPSLYLHRIASNPCLRGKKFLSQIIEWSKSYALTNDCQYLRLDTAGINVGLVNLYIKHGFSLISVAPLKNTTRLLSHYQNIPVCLFEIKLYPALSI